MPLSLTRRTRHQITVADPPRAIQAHYQRVRQALGQLGWRVAEIDLTRDGESTFVVEQTRGGRRAA